MTTSRLSGPPLVCHRSTASCGAVLVVATSGSQTSGTVTRWDDETVADYRARAIAAEGAAALGFPELTFHQLGLKLPVLASATSAAEYANSLGRRVNCGHGAVEGAVVTIRMSTLEDEAHHAGETCEVNGCPDGACEGRAHIDCEACVRDPLIEPNLKRCDWCRRHGVGGDAVAAILTDGVVVLTSQCAGCAAHARGGRLPTRT